MLNTKTQKRIRRHARIRAKVAGTANRPRLSVFKSNMQISSQLIDDEKSITLAAVNDKSIKGKTKSERAKEAGVQIAKLAKDKKIDTVVFDRGGYIFTGRVKAFAEGAKEGGLKF